MKWQFSLNFSSRDHAKQQILKILENISYLKPPEKLLLYLRLPGGYPETGKQQHHYFLLHNGHWPNFVPIKKKAVLPSVTPEFAEQEAFQFSLFVFYFGYNGNNKFPRERNSSPSEIMAVSKERQFPSINTIIMVSKSQQKKSRLSGRQQNGPRTDDDDETENNVIHFWLAEKLETQHLTFKSGRSHSLRCVMCIYAIHRWSLRPPIFFCCLNSTLFRTITGCCNFHNVHQKMKKKTRNVNVLRSLRATEDSLKELGNWRTENRKKWGSSKRFQDFRW
jgi:hypothetical protein